MTFVVILYSQASAQFILTAIVFSHAPSPPSLSVSTNCSNTVHFEKFIKVKTWTIGTVLPACPENFCTVVYALPHIQAMGRGKCWPGYETVSL